MAKAVILSIKNLTVKFKTRNNMLTALRNISFNIYAGETLAIVGESGSGKSVLTKTLTNMLETNGWISNGLIFYYPTASAINDEAVFFKEPVNLIDFHKILLDSDLRKSIIRKNNSIIKQKSQLVNKINSLDHNVIKKELRTLQNKYHMNKQSLDFTKDNNKVNQKLKQLKTEIVLWETYHKMVNDHAFKTEKLQELANDIMLIKSEMARFKKLSWTQRKILKLNIKLLQAYFSSRVVPQNSEIVQIKSFFLKNKAQDGLFERINKLNKLMFQQKPLNEIDLKNLLSEWALIKDIELVNKYKAVKKMSKLRGATIATIFQDPMTSLNPLLSVGFQISEVLIKHRKLSRTEAKKVAIELLTRVGINNAEKRYHNIPGMYSGGMRQRVVIAIALACKPQILICDEPTTALDVTIQAQILDLIKELQKEFKFTIIFITHDLGVVANIADRVAVMYSGQIIEYGQVDEIFFNPQHPYTWDLLLSLPQFAVKGQELYSIPGSPPSLYAQIMGDAFAPRNKYALKIDYLIEPPIFKVSETHYAKTWLCHPQAPKINRPKLTIDDELK